MGKKLKERDIRADLIMASSARRAAKTAKIIAKAIKYPSQNISFTEDIYLADMEGLYHIVRSCDDRVSSLVFVGHNYGITDFAVSLSGEQIVNIPTCGIVALEFDLSSWQRLAPNSGRLLFFDWPKKYTKK